MPLLRRKILADTFKLFDLVIMTISFILAIWVVHLQVTTVSLAEFLSLRVKVQNLVFFLIFLAIWHTSFSLNGLYHSKRLSTLRGEIVDVLKAISLATLAMYIVAIPFSISIFTPFFFVCFWTANVAILFTSRLILRWFLAKVRTRGRNLRHLLIIGSNPRAVRLAERIKSKPELGYRLVGFVDEDWHGIEELKKTGYELVCDLDDFPGFLRANVVDELVITLPVQSNYKQASRISALAEEQGITVRHLSDIFNSRAARREFDELGNDPTVSFYSGTLNGWAVLIKRTTDISLTVVFFILLAPLFLVTAILIKIASPGPVFFKQQRIGLNKRTFLLYKFRTMIPDAEQKLSDLEQLNEVTGPVFKIEKDPRITPIGKWLRKTSIDELPQLFNVLKGDMSLVGPRPLPVRDYEGFSEDWHRRRFSIRPGITCLWQVQGRSSIPFEKWMELDLEYIDRWSLWLDLLILVKTVPAIWKGERAQ